MPSCIIIFCFKVKTEKIFAKLSIRGPGRVSYSSKYHALAHRPARPSTSAARRYPWLVISPPASQSSCYLASGHYSAPSEFRATARNPRALLSHVQPALRFLVRSNQSNLCEVLKSFTARRVCTNGDVLRFFYFLALAELNFFVYVDSALDVFCRDYRGGLRRGRIAAARAAAKCRECLRPLHDMCGNHEGGIMLCGPGNAFCRDKRP